MKDDELRGLVRPLEWLDRGDGIEWALDPFECIYHLEGENWWHNGGTAGSEWRSGGKAAAQADYAARILAALDLTRLRAAFATGAPDDELRACADGFMPFNLNEYIRFRPTPEAHEAFKAYWLKVLPADHELFPTLGVDSDGWAKMQTHEMIATFGGDGFKRGVWCIVSPGVQIQSDLAAEVLRLRAERAELVAANAQLVARDAEAQKHLRRAMEFASLLMEDPSQLEETSWAQSARAWLGGAK